MREPVKYETAAAAAERAGSGASYLCDECGVEADVIDSRKVNAYVIRRRRCPDCGERFSTYEVRL